MSCRLCPATSTFPLLRRPPYPAEESRDRREQSPPLLAMTSRALDLRLCRPDDHKFVDECGKLLGPFLEIEAAAIEIVNGVVRTKQ